MSSEENRYPKTIAAELAYILTYKSKRSCSTNQDDNKLEDNSNTNDGNGAKVNLHVRNIPDVEEQNREEEVV